MLKSMMSVCTHHFDRRKVSHCPTTNSHCEIDDEVDGAEEMLVCTHHFDSCDCDTFLF